MESHELCHILAALNYNALHTAVVPDSFSSPNFILVLDLLKWFGQILSKDFVAPPELREPLKPLKELPEPIIVGFLLKAGQLFNAHLAIQLDLVALYRASGTSCVSELLKIARPIHKAAIMAVEKMNTNSNENKGPRSYEHRNNLSAKGGDSASLEEKVKKTLELLQKSENLRELSQVIGETSGQLEALLSQEEYFNETRVKVMDRRLELAQVEQVLAGAHEGIVAETMALRQTNSELQRDLVRLDERLVAKLAEVNSAKGRLAELPLHSPAYMAQYEKLHKNYELSYEAYVARQRSMTYLKWVLYSDSDEDDDDYDNEVSNEDPKVVAGILAGVQLERANPLGSTLSGATVAAAGRAGATRVALPETVGPPKLAESLLVGASNPMSASLMVEETGAAVVRAADPYAVPVRDTAGGTAAILRPGTAADGSGEYEFLLNELAAESETATGSSLLKMGVLDDDDEIDDGPETTDDEAEDEEDAIGE